MKKAPFPRASPSGDARHCSLSWRNGASGAAGPAPAAPAGTVAFLYAGGVIRDLPSKVGRHCYFAGTFVKAKQAIRLADGKTYPLEIAEKTMIVSARAGTPKDINVNYKYRVTTDEGRGSAVPGRGKALWITVTPERAKGSRAMNGIAEMPHEYHPVGVERDMDPGTNKPRPGQPPLWRLNRS